MSFIVLLGDASQWRGELTGYCPMAASWQSGERTGVGWGGGRGGKTRAVLAASLSALMKALKKKQQPHFHILFAHLSLTTCLKPMFDKLFNLQHA